MKKNLTSTSPFSSKKTDRAKEFSVLVSPEDLEVLMKIIKSKSASHENLACVEDIIVSSARRCC